MRYELKRASRMSDNFILENVSQNIHHYFPRHIALVLGKALLWAIYDNEISPHIDIGMVNRVKAAARSLHSSLAPDVNPVIKVPLVVGGEEGVLVINELITNGRGWGDGGDNDDANDNGAVALSGGVVQNPSVVGVGGGTADSNQICLLVSAVSSLT